MAGCLMDAVAELHDERPWHLQDMIAARRGGLPHDRVGAHMRT
jgi:hypothetical protein